MSSAEAFAAAFAQQAASDLRVYDLLQTTRLPKCHRLHYLQMASEKACKAYLYAGQNGPVAHSNRHDVVEKVLTTWMRRHPAAYSGGMRATVRRYAHEIDRLAPAVDRDSRPDNVEYPWIDRQDAVRTPCLEDFPGFDDFDHRFTSTYKTIQRALREILDEDGRST